MFAFKLIVTALAVISIFNRSIANHEDEEENKSDTDVKIENLPTTATSHDTTEETGPENKEQNVATVNENKEEYEYITNHDACRKFLNRIYSEDNNEANENFYISYKNFNYNFISSFFDYMISMALLLPSESSLKTLNILEFQIKIWDDFYKFLINHHKIDFRGKDQSPNKFCVDTAEQEFIRLSHNLKETETTSEKLAAVCKGLMKTIGIEEPDSASIELAFKMVYLNLNESILSYEGMTDIRKNDESIVVVKYSVEKNRHLVMNTWDRINHKKKSQKTCEHTVEERKDLDVYIKMFLKKYFKYFLKIIENLKKTSTITYVTIESYCWDRGVQLVAESGVKILKEKDKK